MVLNKLFFVLLQKHVCIDDLSTCLMRPMYTSSRPSGNSGSSGSISSSVNGSGGE